MSGRRLSQADMGRARREEAWMHASAKRAKRKVKSFHHETVAGGPVECIEIPPTNQPLRRTAAKPATRKRDAITRVPQSERNKPFHPFCP